MKPENTTSEEPQLTVMFDGACPLCRREVGVYRDLKPLKPIAWMDVSDEETTLDPCGGKKRSDYLARFHVRRADGTLLSGAAAFVALWLTLPGWRWLGRFGSLPGVTPVLEVCYTGFLRIRPAMQRGVRLFDTTHLPADMLADLRSDHAGETGAVWIYYGILCVSPNAKVRAFAKRHLEIEKTHLQEMRSLLPPLKRSLLLPAWRLAGFLTGALPSLFGATAVFATIEAVESFVEQHYQLQIKKLAGRDEFVTLRMTLIDFKADESDHRHEAQAELANPPGRFTKYWCALVEKGSHVAVKLAHKV